MLKRYQRPNKAPSSRVLKSVFSAACGGEGEERGRNLKEEEGERVQDRRTKEEEETPSALPCLAETRRESEGLSLKAFGEGFGRGSEGERVKQTELKRAVSFLFSSRVWLGFMERESPSEIPPPPMFCLVTWWKWNE
ncbi:uncharacterized protein LOC109818036 [Cajanus cajan]|uniref:uncharacterized protein LOC109818036 n=1 Tax=Cajanus cajan TaxID=3821 RepID=UPI00098D7657|nr:uncharacterized protein LOC109818036 [Cajanus cajan]